jgi:hypothetical protein
MPVIREDIAAVVIMTLGRLEVMIVFAVLNHPLLDEPVGRICRLHRVARPRVLAANPGVSARQTSNLFETGKSEERSVPAKTSVYKTAQQWSSVGCSDEQISVSGNYDHI